MEPNLQLWLNRQSYCQLMYILHHYNLVKYEPLAALYLWVDLSCNYEARIQDLFIVMYKHFMANSTQVMHALQIEAPKQYQTFQFQDFLNKVDNLKRQISFMEAYPFWVDKVEDRSSNCSTILSNQLKQCQSKLSKWSSNE